MEIQSLPEIHYILLNKVEGQSLPSDAYACGVVSMHHHFKAFFILVDLLYNLVRTDHGKC